MDALGFIGDALGFIISMLFAIGGFIADMLNEFLSWFSVGQLRLLILGLGIVLAIIAWLVSGRKLSGIAVGVVTYAFGHFMVAVHIMTRPTDDRWRSPDSVAREQPDLPDAPLIGAALDQLEGIIGEVYSGLENVATFSDAIMLASGFAFRGTIWLTALVPLGLMLMYQAAKSRRELKRQQLEQENLNIHLATRVVQLEEALYGPVDDTGTNRQTRY